MTRFHYGSTLDSDMLYLTQYAILDPFFFLETGGKKYVFLSTLDIDAFRESHSGEIEAVDVGPLLKEAAVAKGDVLGNLALRILTKYGVEGEVAVPASFPVSLADFLREKLVRYIVLKNWCPERVVKSDREIAVIRENFEHTKKAYVYIERVLRDSVIDGETLLYKGDVLTSEYLKREVAKLFLDVDMVNTAGIIISSGKQAAFPHHSGGGPIRPHTTIVVDIFPQSSINHYFTDMTRTYVKGTPSADIERMYKAVFEAQKASLSALKPGLTCKEAYEISAKVIKSHGFDVGEKGYIHSLGHGLGVAVHESSTLSSRSQAILEEGQVVTIEPGLYYPDIGGVRIEDTVVITKDGHEDLTQYPYNWIIE